MFRIESVLRPRPFALLFAASAAWSCAQAGPTGVDPGQEETVSLSVKQLSLSFGDSAQLSATVTKKGQSVRDAKLTWSSTDETVVKVNGNGKVRAVGPGNGKVVAKGRSGGADTATVVVTPTVATIELSPQTYDFTAVGQTLQLVATAFDDSGNPVENVGLEWSTTNATVATVDSMGKVTSKGAGTATIVAAAVCCTVSATATVTVVDGQQAVAPGNAWFSDGFESGDLSHTENGFRWLHTDAVVSGDQAHSGSYSMKFAYMANPLDQNQKSEERFEIAADAAHAPKAIWLEYWVRVPENIGQELLRAKARHDAGLGYGNKFLSLWSEYYDNRLGDAETTLEWQTFDFQYFHIDPVVFAGTDAHNKISPYKRKTVDQPIFRAEDAGKWVRFRVYAKARCKDEVNLRIWQDDRLVLEIANMDTTPYDGQTSYLDYFRHGYLFGASFGFDEPTAFYVDDFRAYTSDPGW